MKRVTAIFFVLLISAYLLIAQNYQTVYPDRIAYFCNDAGNIKCIRIDSVGLMELIPFKNIQLDEDGCHTPFGPSWIGEKVRLSDSFNSFFNRRNEMISIKTDALLNESWTAYYLTDSIFIVATVIDTANTSFLGIQDNVKTIGFQAYNKRMIPKVHPVNDKTLMISENYGFVKTLNFYLFPDIENFLPPYNLEEYDLVGLSNPQLGIQNLTSFEVYDFQEGDEIHVYYESSRRGCGEDKTEIRKSIYRYLARNDYTDSIVYDVEIWRSEQTTLADTSLYSYKHYTAKSMILPDPMLEYLPDEPIFSSYGAYYLYMIYDSILSKTDPATSGLLLVYWNDSCWAEIVVDGCEPSYKYIKGLGGPYYSCSEFSCLGGTVCQLVYYKKGNKTWGTPLVISAIPEAGRTTDYEIYPNPVKDWISVKVTSSVLPLQLELFDLSGKTIMQLVINSKTATIKLEKDMKGIYLYRIIDKSKNISYGKLVVE